MRTLPIQIRRDDCHLSGRLDLPDGEGRTPFPAVIFVHGSGPTNLREENRYASVREAFTRAGAACLMWDKPGCGASGGRYSTFQSYRERAEEVVAAVAALERRSDIDSARIGLWGLSQGAWIASMAAKATANDVAFMILVSGPSRDFAHAATYTARANLALDGYSQPEIDRYVQAVDRCLRLAQSGASYEAFIEASAPLRGHRFFRMTGWDRIRRSDWENPGLQENLRVRIEPLLRDIACPVLALFGEKDTQIDWRKSIAVYRRVLAEASNPDVTIETFPGANHNLRRCTTGSIRETRESTGREYVPGFVKTMTRWLKGKVLSSNNRRP